VFSVDGVVYRQVNAVFGDGYRRLMKSGLYDELARDRLIVAHEEVPLRLADAPPALAVLQPQQVPFISYPYEWCFSELKAAALLTLDLQRRALASGMILRDASAYNVQFVGTRPIFIDTLSFGEYVEGQPWSAYRQFCQHFLAPLALMAHAHSSLGELARVHIDGIHLDLATSLLPLSSRLRPGLLMHLHLHNRILRKVPNMTSAAPQVRGTMNRTALLGLIDGLERTVRGIVWKPAATIWSSYVAHMNYSDAAQQHKRRLVGEMISMAAASGPLRMIWDLGANTGDYTRLAAATGAHVVSIDGDHTVVEQHFAQLRESSLSILPLIQDLTNPSPGVGWTNSERRSLLERGPADLVLALALVHHLAIGSNVPLESLAAFFERICRRLIIEFVSKQDSQVQRMLTLRDDVFTGYTQSAFERAFSDRFRLVRLNAIEGTVRTLYLMERR
jgi:ribosomal protein L11 methylase PrmA